MNWVFQQSVLRRLLLDLLHLGDTSLKHSKGPNEYYYIVLRSAISTKVFYEIGGEIGLEEGGNIWINCAYSEDGLKKMCLLSYNTFYDMTPETYKELSAGLAAIIHNTAERIAALRLSADSEAGRVTVESTNALRKTIDEELISGVQYSEGETGNQFYVFDEETIQKIQDEFTYPCCGKPVSSVKL